MGKSCNIEFITYILKSTFVVSRNFFLLISLHVYFHQAMKSNPNLKKGIKLDFKQTNILEKSLKSLAAKLDRINFPVWINADILKGPGMDVDPSNRDPDVFLGLTNKYAPNATVSPGK